MGLKLYLDRFHGARLAIGLGVAVLAVVVAGCGGSDLSTLTGKITVAGQAPPPEARGRITFQPEGTGPTVMGQIMPDGSYIAQTGETAGIPVGKYRVNIYGTIGIPAMGGKSKEWVPRKYLDYDTSNLEIEVVKGKNVKDFDLDKK